jgi:hypothetical protein
MTKNVRGARVRLRPTWKTKPDADRLGLALWLLVSQETTERRPLAEVRPETPEDER